MCVTVLLRADAADLDQPAEQAELPRLPTRIVDAHEGRQQD
jgi:hypothetical protein